MSWVKTDIPAFDRWWEQKGQYLRAGGTDYERTFAYEAFKDATDLQKTQESVDFFKRTLPDAALPGPAGGSEPKTRRYFVSYSYSGRDGSFGNGWVEVDLKKPIRGTADLEFIRDLVLAEKGFKEVAITNWQRFEEQ
jgi:hypothetical protein